MVVAPLNISPNNSLAEFLLLASLILCSLDWKSWFPRVKCFYQSSQNSFIELGVKIVMCSFCHETSGQRSLLYRLWRFILITEGNWGQRGLNLSPGDPLGCVTVLPCSIVNIKAYNCNWREAEVLRSEIFQR